MNQSFAESASNALSLPGLVVDVRSEWNSRLPDSRLRIREAIAAELTRLGALSPADKTRLLDLALVPRLNGVSVSVSHCATAGGFALSLGERRIGLDIEEFSRIRGDVVARVSSESEFSAAPLKETLWVAKEAVFKAIDNGGGLVVTMIEIQDWREISLEHWLFTATAGVSKARGLVARENSELLCLAVSAN